MKKPDDLPSAFPLQWPIGRPRTPANQRRRAKFGVQVTKQSAVDPSRSWKTKGDLTIAQARDRVLHELALMGAMWPVLSSNLRLRADELPISKQRAPDDPGIAVYFFIDGRSHCLACDRWDRIQDNMAAIAKHVEAMRGIDRWGVGTLEQAFAGYRASLPPPGSDWRSVFGFSNGGNPTLEQVQQRYREKMKEHHPDLGGDPNEAVRFNQAMAAAEQELSV